jgi:phosphoglycolate phosphatase
MQTGNNAKAALVIGVLWGFRKEDELRENGADVIVNETLQILEEVKKLA